MANKLHIEILKKGVHEWNKWVKAERGNNDIERKKYWDELKKDNDNGIHYSAPLFLPFQDFIGADLEDYDLGNAILVKADFKDANLRDTNFQNANLSEVNFESADLRGANLKNAVLTKANLIKCKIDAFTNFDGANLSNADIEELFIYEGQFKNAIINKARLIDVKIDSSNFEGADLSDSEIIKSEIINSNLRNTKFLNTRISNCHIENCNIFGASIWSLSTSNTIQKDLQITDSGELDLYVDDLELANYIFLVRNDGNISKIINASTSKFVLILGRFSESNKKTLELIKNNIRAYQYLPILFDFQKPESRNITETVGILAKLSRFIIVDITTATFVLHELNQIIPVMVNLPITPILLKGEYESLVFEHWKKFPWVLPTYEYDGDKELLNNLFEKIIEPSERMLYSLTGIEPPKRLDSEDEIIGAPI